MEKGEERHGATREGDSRGCCVGRHSRCPSDSLSACPALHSYHTQVLSASTSTTPASLLTGTTYSYTTVGPFQCWKADISAVRESLCEVSCVRPPLGLHAGWQGVHVRN